MTVTWDDARKVPYGCDSKHWVGYDNELSLYEKVRGVIMAIMSKSSIVYFGAITWRLIYLKYTWYIICLGSYKVAAG